MVSPEAAAAALDPDRYIVKNDVDLAQMVKADEHFSRALALKPDFVPGLHRRALSRHAAGDHLGAVSDLSAALEISPSSHEMRDLLGISLASIGRLRSALAQFDCILTEQKTHWAAHHRAVVAILAKQFDKPISSDATGPLDTIVPAQTKHGTSKQLDASHAAASAAKAACMSADAPEAPSPPPPPRPDAATLLREAHTIGERMQVRAAGFVPNDRLRRQAGLAAIEVAQRVRSLLAEGAAFSASAADAVGWRSVYDVAVLWLQLG